MNEAYQTWNAVIATLRQRGLLASGQSPVADGILLPDRLIFVLDMQRLAGIPREAWLDPDLQRQLRAALGGRPVVVTDSFGLAVQVGRQPLQPPQPLPRHVPLDLSHCPSGLTYPVPLGVGRRGPVWASLPDLGHILVGGTTRTGKTAWIRAVLTALVSVHTADEVRIAVVDPKGVDFSGWQTAHTLGVATEVEGATHLVGEVLNEAEARQARFAAVGATNLAAYVRAAGPLPVLVLVVDEFIDLAVLAGPRSPFYRSLLRLASKGAGLGIYLVLSATNPKAEVINTLIRANCSTRVAFRCAERRQSEAILEVAGAEVLPAVPGRLLARLPGSNRLVELQGYYVEGAPSAEAGPVLSEEERELVVYAVERLGGAFPVGQLAEAFRGRMTAWRIRVLAEEWERRGWLTRPRHATDPRRVTEELLGVAGLGRTGTQAAQGA